MNSKAYGFDFAAVEEEARTTVETRRPKVGKRTQRRATRIDQKNIILVAFFTLLAVMLLYSVLTGFLRVDIRAYEPLLSSRRSDEQTLTSAEFNYLVQERFGSLSMAESEAFIEPLDDSQPIDRSMALMWMGRIAEYYRHTLFSDDEMIALERAHVAQDERQNAMLAALGISLDDQGDITRGEATALIRDLYIALVRANLAKE